MFVLTKNQNPNTQTVLLFLKQTLLVIYRKDGRLMKKQKVDTLLIVRIVALLQSNKLVTNQESPIIRNCPASVTAFYLLGLW